MDLKQTIKKVLEEQLWSYDPKTTAADTKKPVFKPTEPKKSEEQPEEQPTVEKIDVGVVDVSQDLIDAYGIDLVKQAYEKQGFKVTQEGNGLKVTGWALPLPKQYIKSPGPTLKYGAGRPAGCTSDCRSTHEGVDYAAPNGTTIYATKGGKITDAHFLTDAEIKAGNHCGPGQLILVSGKYTIIHCHLSKIYVSKGDTVSIGQAIGEVGEGHLHIEIDVSGDRKGIDNWSQIYSQLV